MFLLLFRCYSNFIEVFANLFKGEVVNPFLAITEIQYLYPEIPSFYAITLHVLKI